MFTFGFCLFDLNCVICGFKHVSNTKKLLNDEGPNVRKSKASRGAKPSWRAK